MTVSRKDLPTAIVVAAIRVHGSAAFEVLCEEFPPKVVLAAYERDIRKGLLECGVCTERAWIK